MRKERKSFFCLAENVLVDSFRSRNKFGMTVMLLEAPFMFGESGEASQQCVATMD